MQMEAATVALKLGARLPPDGVQTKIQANMIASLVPLDDHNLFATAKDDPLLHLV